MAAYLLGEQILIECRATWKIGGEKRRSICAQFGPDLRTFSPPNKLPTLFLQWRAQEPALKLKNPFSGVCLPATLRIKYQSTPDKVPAKKQPLESQSSPSLPPSLSPFLSALHSKLWLNSEARPTDRKRERGRRIGEECTGRFARLFVAKMDINQSVPPPPIVSLPSPRH